MKAHVNRHRNCVVSPEAQHPMRASGASRRGKNLAQKFSTMAGADLALPGIDQYLINNKKNPGSKMKSVKANEPMVGLDRNPYYDSAVNVIESPEPTQNEPTVAQQELTAETDDNNALEASVDVVILKKQDSTGSVTKQFDPDAPQKSSMRKHQSLVVEFSNNSQPSRDIALNETHSIKNSRRGTQMGFTPQMISPASATSEINFKSID